ncbi:hypothetical protein THIX_30403 [Thiomonas sp. X19]|uniref:toprim domain-containing protein n=1 Tax=Thiomonas sp. X19 TaxID=1050370 RepID=UPI000B7017F5|nr:toprim domain-containing protein [Thiomonas sp. X19]SCC93175.1 hypothetical protein THIX_30403 [Thiomonas sp. X19]
MVICEGIGTALAIHQATGLPVIAALSAQNLPEVARRLHGKLQGHPVLYADHDGANTHHKGQTDAVRAARILGSARTRIALPLHPHGPTPPGYDARDQLRDGGVEAIRRTLAATLTPRQLERRLPPAVILSTQPSPASAPVAPKANPAPVPSMPRQEPPMPQSAIAEPEVPTQPTALETTDPFKALNDAAEDLEREAQPPDGPAGERYAIDQDHMAAEAILAHLSPEAERALAAATLGEPLTPAQRLLLNDGRHRDLIDDTDQPTPLGQLAHRSLQAKVEEERAQLQQQLRTRNIDAVLGKPQRQTVKQERAQEQAQEQGDSRILESRPTSVLPLLDLSPLPMIATAHAVGMGH